MSLEDSRVSSTIEIKKNIFSIRFRDSGFVGFRDLGFVKFQFPIISLISFCSYLLFFLKNIWVHLDITYFAEN